MDRLKFVFSGCADALRKALRFPGRTDFSGRKRRPADDEDDNDEDDDDDNGDVEEEEEMVIEVEENERWDEDRGWGARHLRPKGGDPARYTSGDKGAQSHTTFLTPPLAAGYEYTGKWRVDFDAEGAATDTFLPLPPFPHAPSCSSQARWKTVGFTGKPSRTSTLALLWTRRPRGRRNGRLWYASVGKYCESSMFNLTWTLLPWLGQVRRKRWVRTVVERPGNALSAGKAGRTKDRAGRGMLGQGGHGGRGEEEKQDKVSSRATKPTKGSDATERGGGRGKVSASPEVAKKPPTSADGGGGEDVEEDEEDEDVSVGAGGEGEGEGDAGRTALKAMFEVEDGGDGEEEGSEADEEDKGRGPGQGQGRTSKATARSIQVRSR